MKIGIDLGGSHISAGIVRNGEILKQVGQDIDKKDDIENLIINGISNLIKELTNESNEKIEKIGISAPGIIANNKIVKATNLNLYNFDIIERLKALYNIFDITIKNDGKSAAIAEKNFGTMKGFKDAVFINIGTGIGGAVFIDNKLLVPEKSAGFELGHMVIEKNGKQCSCGKRGCFEAYCSIKCLKECVKNKLDLRSNITGKELREIIEVKENKVESILNEYIDNLSIGISNIIDIFEPQVICFGGSFSNYEQFLDRLKQKLQEPNKLFSLSKFPEFVMASLGNEAGVIGAVLDK